MAVAFCPFVHALVGSSECRDNILRESCSNMVSFVFRAQSHAGMIKKDSPGAAATAPAAAEAKPETGGEERSKVEEEE